MENTQISGGRMIGLYLLLAVSVGLMTFVALPYLGMFVLSLTLAVATEPLFTCISRYVRSSGLAATITSLLLIVMVIIPLYIFALLAINQLTALGETVSQYVSNNQTQIDSVEQFLGKIEIDLSVDTVVGSAVSVAKTYLVPFIVGNVTLVMNLVFFTVLLIYQYLGKESLIASMKRLIPLPPAVGADFVDRLFSSSRVILRSIVIASMTQALASTVMYIILGIPAPLFWFFALFLASFLPLGSGLLTVPISFILMLTGNVLGGIILLAWHTVVVSSLDNVVRAYLFKRSVIELPELLTFIATLGGLATFGFFGVIYGPLVAVIFVLSLELYTKYNTAET